MLRGTSPPWRSTRPRAKPVMLRAFARKKPVERMISSTSASGAAGQRAGVGVALEEDGRDLVDALVGALRGEDGGDGELEGAAVVERAAGLGVRLLQDVEDAGARARA